MFAVDTNILVYAHFERYPQHEAARSFCAERLLGRHEWCLGWQVVYEYIRIVTHPRVHKEPLSLGEALSDLAPYLGSEHCHVLTQTPMHSHVLELVAQSQPGVSGNIIHDLHYAVLLKEHNVRKIVTADSDFRRFDFLEVVDPTAP